MFRTLSTLLGRLSVGRKLLLIYLLDLTAVIFISGILINEKFIAIDFARKELAGNAYIKALRPSLLDVGGAWPAGMAPLPPASPFDAERIEAAHGTGMESHQLALAYAAKLQGLQSLHNVNAVVTAAERQRLQQEALDRGRDLVTRVGNQSNLILDPDLDSYYTMSLVLLRYPELLEIVSRICGHMHALEGLPDRRTNTEARTRYFILEGRLDATAKGIESDQSEAFTAAADGQLRNALEPAQARLLQAIERFRQATHATLQGGGSLGMNEVERSQRELVAALDLAWGQAGVELDRLVETRIHGFFVRMWLHLGTALFLLLLILSAVFYVARQIARPLQRLSAVTDEVRRTGDHSLRAEWNSGDEIGRLVLGFNDMLAQLDRERSIQQELAASARAAQAQKNLLEALPIPMVVTAVPGHEVLHANGPAQQWLGERRTDPWVVGLEPGVRVRFFQQLADREVVDEFEVRWRAGTEPTWAVLSARRLQYQGQDAVLTAFTPINHLKQMEQRLELWAKVFEASSEGILIIDGEHRVLTGNHAFCRNTAYDLAEVVGRAPDFLIAGDGGERFFTELWPTLDKRGTWQGEVRLRRRNDSEFPAWLVINAVRAGPGRISHYIFTSLDISDRKASEERIHFLAHHDVLTGLPNRTLCIERLRLAMQQAQRTGQKVGVLFIDLDRFKTINDSLGHHVGDGLLRSVAMRLLEAVRTGDTVCRLGGDEFIVVLNGAHDSNEILGIVERRLIPLIRRTHVIDGAELHVSCSVGMAIYPDDASDIDEVLRHADVAMYQAKAMGRDSAQFFTPELNERAHKRLRLESQLRRAIERDELSLHYQPRIAARSGAVVGVEALLRWQSAELGSVPPAEFIPIAEESRQIVAIGAWVIGEACRQHALWREQGRGEVAVSINLSALQLHDPGLIGVLEAAIQRHGVRPGALELELTESTLMNVEHTLPHLQRLRALGVQLSVDDFGTGYSSLNYLHRFPIDRLKIDRSFVGDMLDDPANLAIIRAIIGLGHTLGLQVVAEGVESEEVATALLGAHCDELQGYHFARPLTAHALGQWLDARSGERVRG